MKILLTGASGFVGARLLDKNHGQKDISTVSLQKKTIREINFSNIDTIIHCAGVAHRMEKTADKLYFSVNRDLTLALAQAGKAAGVKQFVFLSTIKVYGKDFSEDPITLQTPCIPNDPYGQSKWEAEEGLRKLEGENFKIAIIRPPLIYGPRAKGNLRRLMQLINSQQPVPLGGIANRRSMIFIDNLIDLIHQIIDKKASGTYLSADYPPISTSQLVKLISKTLNTNKTIITLPLPLRWIIKQIRPGFHQRLFGSLEVDASESYGRLSFTPQYSQEDGLKEMTEAFRNSKA